MLCLVALLLLSVQALPVSTASQLRYIRSALTTDEALKREAGPGAQTDPNSPEVKQALEQHCKGFQRPWVAFSSTLPEANIAKKCQAGERIFGDRLVVVARHKEDVSWLVTHLQPPFLVYQAGSNSSSHTSVNLGNEVSAYLTFIAEYYECLPETVLFAHAHRFSKTHSVHTLDFDANNVRWDKVPGFAPKHRYGLWIEVNHIHDPTLVWTHPRILTVEEAKTFNCLAVYKGIPYTEWDSLAYAHAVMVSRAWDELYGPLGMGPKPERIRTSFAAEMFVTAKAMRAHPRNFYTKALQWMHDSHARGANSNWALGGMFELTWHIIFGQPAYMEQMPIAECELYKCDKEAAIADRKFLVEQVKEIKAKEAEEKARLALAQAGVTAG